jgi:hypothetical protein
MASIVLKRRKIKKDMKNFLYYNSVAAHPYYRIGSGFEDHRSEGLFKLQTLDIYNNMNK